MTKIQKIKISKIFLANGDTQMRGASQTLGWGVTLRFLF